MDESIRVAEQSVRQLKGGPLDPGLVIELREISPNEVADMLARGDNVARAAGDYPIGDDCDIEITTATGRLLFVVSPVWQRATIVHRKVAGRFDVTVERRP